MAEDRTNPADVPAADRDAQREIADRAGQHDPAIEQNKEKAKQDQQLDKRR